MKKVVTIFGTRPEIIKLSPVLPVFDQEFEHITIHTGQHYSHNMDQIFINELGLKEPNYNLKVGSGSHARQTSAMLIGIEDILLKEKPDLVVVFADPNTPLAGALAATKLNIPVVHMEAGCRSFNRNMPEEINRILADHCSDILLAPDQPSCNNLLNEGIPAEKIHVVGSTAYTSSLRNRDLAKKSKILENLNVEEGNYLLATIHRAENTNDLTVLREMFEALNEISKEKKIVIPLHPRTKKLIESQNIKLNEEIIMIEPQGYINFLKLLDCALFVLTDSGGIQEEAAALDTPCVVLRNETEMMYLIEMGKNILAGTQKEKIIKISQDLINNQDKLEKMKNVKVDYPEGIAEKIVEILKNA